MEILFMDLLIMNKTMKQLILKFVVIFILTGLTNVNAQISQEGIPFSFSTGEKSTLSKDVPVVVMPFVDVDVLKAEDQILDTIKNIPWRFGQNIEVSISPDSHGLVEILEDGSTLWRVSVSSPGALSLNFLFDQYSLPPGAALFIYNEDRSEVFGAFTDYNNQPDMMFATTLIGGDFMTLEYFEPADAPFSGILHLSRVTHGYRGPWEYIKGFGQSGSCNVNVACPESAGMEDQIRSSCMLVTGSSGFCSASLINNTRNDGSPYVLSADHCFTNPGSVVFWFNWQSPNCPNPPTSPSYNSVSGATTLARYSTSDMWLMEINQPIPSNFNVYYSGWNRTMDDNITGKIWGIHHPSGDIKKISWSMLGVSTTTYLQNSVPGNGSHWRVTQWSDGTTTEGGSSGSPLYDSQGRIIGQLHGGYASCSSMTSDWYGKLGVSWTGGGTNATRLSNWLDPDNTGADAIEGYDPNTPSVDLDAQMLTINAPLMTYCSVETIVPEVVIKNRGSQPLTSATVSYVMNSGSPVTINWTGNLTTGQTAVVSFSPVTLIPNANQTFNASVTNPNGGIDQLPANDQISMTFNVYADYMAPFSENFDGAVFPPACWNEETVSGSVSWVKANGGHSGNPSSAYSGNGNALLYYGSYSSVTTKLITPPLKILALINPVLTFWHAQVPWSGDQDELKVYYRTSGTAPWTLLESYTTAVNTWTLRTIQLPNATDTYYIAFEGITDYGYGVCIDDVVVTGGNVGIDHLVNSEINIYPNPSDGKVSVEFPGDNTFGSLNIYNTQGQLVGTYRFDAGETNMILDLEHLSEGVYVLHFVSAQASMMKKLIIH
jgi:lysyl endopeptidase